MMNSIAASSQRAPFSVRLNQAAGALVKANIVPNFDSINNVSAKPLSQFNDSLNTAADGNQQSGVGFEENKRTVGVDINRRQHQQEVIDLYLAIASEAQQNHASSASHGDLLALSGSVKLNRLASSAINFEIVQKERYGLQQQYEDIIRPQPEPVIRTQA